MLAQSSLHFELTDWTTWLTVGVGIAVAALVMVVVILWGRWRRRRRLGFASTEEELPWDQLLEILETRSRERAAAGLSLDDEPPPDQLLKQLLLALPSHRRRAADLHPEDWNSSAYQGTEQRGSRRRWGNPTEVQITWLAGPDRLHGLVINRSTGGLAIFVDMAVPDCTVMHLRPAAAPSYVATTMVEVRYCRKVSKSFLLGCRFCSEVPWNVRVWFG